MVKIGAIIQARMGSTRLPGKVMKKINNRELLWYSYNRAFQSTLLDLVIIATTKNKRDDVIVKWCQENNINYIRGSEDDVLDRYYQAAKEYQLDIVVRLTSDNPFCDPEIIDMLIKKILESDTDYVSNRIKKRTYPYGLDAEVFTFASLKEAWQNANLKEQREHVTPYIMSHPKKFKLLEVQNNEDLADYRLTVDDPEDFRKASLLIEQYMADKKQWREIIEILEKIK